MCEHSSCHGRTQLLPWAYNSSVCANMAGLAQNYHHSATCIDDLHLHLSRWTMSIKRAASAQTALCAETTQQCPICSSRRRLPAIGATSTCSSRATPTRRNLRHSTDVTPPEALRLENNLATHVTWLIAANRSNVRPPLCKRKTNLKTKPQPTPPTSRNWALICLKRKHLCI